MDEVQLRGMIRHAAKSYPFLDATSEDAVYSLARLMIDVDYVVDRMTTPVRASLEFLRSLADQRLGPGARIAERDFVFVIKMFGLKIRNKGGLLEFLPRNEWVRESSGEKPAIEVTIDDQTQAKTVEFEISDVQRHRKIHGRRIEAAYNRLVRLHRDTELALIFVSLVNGGKTIGEAKDELRNNFDVKDHEYNRIRERALELGIFDRTRKRTRTQGRITLDPDVMAFVEEQAAASQGGRMHRRTPSQMANEMLRDFHFLLKKKPLIPAPKSPRGKGTGDK
ncbi:hypothetical protein [Burkholderia ubonensis]|uniref:hypothetical protein n=1 Tax=Burkholderia ubonensis TaxID=101571 RepID=UPI00076D3478|nr:hypothetical protein [Burkholderia ubonensis]KVV07453.1 hypothetical protein WK77_16845 [Burkholderia ubonensis]